MYSDDVSGVKSSGFGYGIRDGWQGVWAWHGEPRRRIDLPGSGYPVPAASSRVICCGAGSALAA
jgi:hypothetical protein